MSGPALEEIGRKLRGHDRDRQLECRAGFEGEVRRRPAQEDRNRMLERGPLDAGVKRLGARAVELRLRG